MQVNTPTADINQLTRLDVGQHPLVLRDGGCRSGLGEDDVTDGKRQGGCQSGLDSAKCESGHGCPLPSRVAQFIVEMREISANPPVAANATWFHVKHRYKTDRAGRTCAEPPSRAGCPCSSAVALREYTGSP